MPAVWPAQRRAHLAAVLGAIVAAVVSTVGDAHLPTNRAAIDGPDVAALSGTFVSANSLSHWCPIDPAVEWTHGNTEWPTQRTAEFAAIVQPYGAAQWTTDRVSFESTVELAVGAAVPSANGTAVRLSNVAAVDSAHGSTHRRT